MEKLSKKEQFEFDYAQRYQAYERLRTEAHYEIETALQAAQIKVHTLHSRIKNLDSAYGKAQRKGMADPIRDLDDIVGLRIVAIFLSDLVQITEVLTAAFDVEKTDDKMQSLLPSEFGYMSVHLIARIRSTFQGTRYDTIKEIPFEIQVRTIAMDAWAAASHYLDYKTETDVPLDLRRDFHALSGLFYVADQHFELFFKARVKTKTNVKNAFETSLSPLSQLVNLDTVTAFLERKYPDRVQCDSEDVSSLVDSLRAADIETLGQLDDLLNSRRDAFLDYERQAPPSSSTNEPEEYSAIGVVRLSLLHLPAFEPDVDRTEYLHSDTIFGPSE